MYDAFIVGCGFSGSVIARYLAETCNKKVLVVERRNHIAGNMYDFKDENGLTVQLYGPHTFHTTKKKLYDYVLKYGQWEDYKLTCMVQIDGKFTPSPFNFQTIDDFYSIEDANRLKSRIAEIYPGKAQATIVDMLESADPLVRQYAKFLFDKDYSLYTAKQWGVSPSEIDISVLKRIPVLFSYKTGYFDDPYQVMPKDGFTAFFTNILNHPNIEVRLNTDIKDLMSVDFQNNRLLLDGKAIAVPVIYTGALDDLLDYRFGVLPYRSLRFDFQTVLSNSYQDVPVVAYPQAEGFTRITEYAKLPIQKTDGRTKIAVEYPLEYVPNKSTEPYYPVLTQEGTCAYQKYRQLLSPIPNLFLCGRLADFKYYNMDQAIERAFAIIDQIDSGEK